MFCNNCKCERLDSDFINKQEFCYHCVYRIKMQNNTEKRKSKKKYCRICDKEIFAVKNQIGRQRTVFCSTECAKKGHQEMIKDYWTRKIRNKSYPYQKTLERKKDE